MIYRGLVECEVDVEFHSIEYMLNARKVQHVFSCLWVDDEVSIYSLKIDGVSTKHECSGFAMYCDGPMEIILHIEDHDNGPQVRRIYHRPGLVHGDRVKLLLREVGRLDNRSDQESVVSYNHYDPWRIDEKSYSELFD